MSDQQWHDPQAQRDSAAFEPPIPVVRTSSGDLRVGDASSIEAAQDKVHREAAKRVARRRGFQAHLMSFLAVNGFLIMIWVLSGGGYFWPAFPMGGWAIGLVMHWWSVVAANSHTADIQAEVRRLTRAPRKHDDRS